MRSHACIAHSLARHTSTTPRTPHRHHRFDSTTAAKAFPLFFLTVAAKTLKALWIAASDRGVRGAGFNLWRAVILDPPTTWDLLMAGELSTTRKSVFYCNDIGETDLTDAAHKSVA